MLLLFSKRVIDQSGRDFQLDAGAAHLRQCGVRRAHIGSLFACAVLVMTASSADAQRRESWPGRAATVKPRPDDPESSGDWRVTADTSFAAYEVRSPRSRVVYARRRLVSRLGIRYARRLDEAGRWSLTLDVDLRLDHDFGSTCLVFDEERCVQADDVSDRRDFQVLARNTRIDARRLSATIRGPHRTTLRLGRVLRMDPIGALRLDGLSVSTAATSALTVRAYGGLLVRSGSWLGSAAFEPSGSLQVELPELLSPDRAPFVAEPTRTYALGAELELAKEDRVRGRVMFRETRDEIGSVARRVAAAASVDVPLSGSARPSGRLGRRATPRTSLRAEAFAAVAVDADPGLVDAFGQVTLRHARARYFVRADHHEPRFDLGTIWAWFPRVPVTRVTLGTHAEVRGATFGGAVRYRRSRPGDATERDVGADVSMMVPVRAALVSVSGSVTEGSLMPLASLTLHVNRRFILGALYGRASLWHFRDGWRQNVAATSVSTALGFRLEVTPLTRVGAELEHAYNGLVGHRFRMLATFSTQVWR